VALAHVCVDPCRSILVEEVDRDPAHALLPQLAGQRAQTLLATRDQYERGARLAGETARRRFADSARGAGDEDDG
jgi:hypothetical protein